MSTKFTNPVIPGYFPDPSICRVGDDFYLVNSTFEYFPGVPLHHSRDLVHWRTIGHCLTRPSQLPLQDAGSSRGIFAPVIRHHRGTFYMITTNVSREAHLIVTASDPAGPWSEPLWIEDEGVDPSLFFDDDGRVYFTRQGGGERGGAYQAEIDLAAGQLKEKPRLLWRGTGGVWPEGPHLFKRGGWYYLMIAEGGTGYDHAVTIARCRTPWGPFEPCPRNPILTHKDLPSNPVHAVGHADLVETARGDWYLVCLAIRPKDGRYHHLGRETHLSPVTWDNEGWPVVNGNGRLPSYGMVALSAHPWEERPVRDMFQGPSLGHEWIYLRKSDPLLVSVDKAGGGLRLLGNVVSLDETGYSAFVGRRQQHFKCRMATSLVFRPDREGQEAGMTIRANENFRFDLFVTKGPDGLRAFFRVRKNGNDRKKGFVDLEGNEVELLVEAYDYHYEFYAGTPGKTKTSLGMGRTKDLSTEVAGGFTGVVAGLYSTGRGHAGVPPALFRYFDYEPL